MLRVASCSFGFPPAQNRRTKKSLSYSRAARCLHHFYLSFAAVAAPPLAGALAAPAALPAVASRHRVRGTSSSPAGRPCDDGSIAAPMSGSRARAVPRAGPRSPPARCAVPRQGKRFLDRFCFRIHCVSYINFFVFVFEFAGKI